jgi:hypothetical protein
VRSPRSSSDSAVLGKRRVLMGLPLVGGLLDSVIGILTGTVYGIAPQLGALLSSLGLPGPV